MCGVPYHAAESYIARLVQRGYRVAVCDQVEDPRFAKKLVKRELNPRGHAGDAPSRLCCAPTRITSWPPFRERSTRRPGLRRCFDRRVPRHRTGCRRGPSTPNRLARARCFLPRKARWRAAVPPHRSGGVGLRLRLRREELEGALQAARPGRLRPHSPPPCRGRGRCGAALSQGHSEIRARPPRPPLFFERTDAMILDAGRSAISNWSSSLRSRSWGRPDATLAGVIDRTSPAWADAFCARACSVPPSTASRSRRAWTGSRS